MPKVSFAGDGLGRCVQRDAIAPSGSQPKPLEPYNNFANAIDE
ncbi:hypothetical protein [Laspinema olomoucense]|nr:hypothetical protein [Laspinema sp. D3c]